MPALIDFTREAVHNTPVVLLGLSVMAVSGLRMIERSRALSFGVVPLPFMVLLLGSGLLAYAVAHVACACAVYFNRWVKYRTALKNLTDDLQSISRWGGWSKTAERSAILLAWLHFKTETEGLGMTSDDEDTSDSDAAPVNDEDEDADADTECTQNEDTAQQNDDLDEVEDAQNDDLDEVEDAQNDDLDEVEEAQNDDLDEVGNAQNDDLDEVGNANDDLDEVGNRDEAQEQDAPASTANVEDANDNAGKSSFVQWDNPTSSELDI